MVDRVSSRWASPRRAVIPPCSARGVWRAARLLYTNTIISTAAATATVATMTTATV